VEGWAVEIMGATTVEEVATIKALVTGVGDTMTRTVAGTAVAITKAADGPAAVETLADTMEVGMEETWEVEATTLDTTREAIQADMEEVTTRKVVNKDIMLKVETSRAEAIIRGIAEGRCEGQNGQITDT